MNIKLETKNAQSILFDDVKYEITFKINIIDYQIIKSRMFESKITWWNLIIQTIKQIRSVGYRSQNHHVNGHCQQIAEETGNDFNDVKMHCKHAAVSMGYPILYNKKGNPMHDLSGKVRGISESNASKEECAILIEAAHKLAAELNIALKEYDNETT